MAAQERFALRFWGVRGTVACPGEATLRYGGNTSCIEVVCGTQRLLFDAGTGIRALGRDMVAGGVPVDAHLFLTHTHMDHISGLPFFRPAYGSDHRFDIWAGHLLPQGKRIEPTLAKFMEPAFFPVPLEIMRPCVRFHDFAAGEPLDPAPGVRIETLPLNHPGGATGYKVQFAGRTACIVTDTEHVAGRLDDSILQFIAGSDLVIYDSTYTDAEYPNFVGWGHSTWQEGVRLCRAAGVRRLVPFHHEPEHDDAFLDAIANDLEQALPGSPVACEGLVIEL
ncbi:MAG: MBL fold metallo-hydrolase [Geminicoccaceae bacterium]|nr:MBL fold metallo-hydrolase [Geminicoccaceae bacterium]